MNLSPIGFLAFAGGIAFLLLALLGAVALADDDMMDGMWDMMDGGMMDGRDGRGVETKGTASGQGEVRIANFEYEPSVLDVTPGTEVTWTNEDGAPHTATAQDDSFDTGRLDKGESGEITFDTPGTYQYICAVHPEMQGQIVVSAPVP